jgi:hypothetical protein
MAGISTEVQMVLYGLLVIIMGFAGYYIGKIYAYPMVGAGVGVVSGLVISGIMYKFMGDGSSQMMRGGYGM